MSSEDYDGFDFKKYLDDFIREVKSSEWGKDVKSFDDSLRQGRYDSNMDFPLYSQVYITFRDDTRAKEENKTEGLFVSKSGARWFYGTDKDLLLKVQIDENDFISCMDATTLNRDAYLARFRNFLFSEISGVQDRVRRFRELYDDGHWGKRMSFSIPSNTDDVYRLIQNECIDDQANPLAMIHHMGRFPENMLYSENDNDIAEFIIDKGERIGQLPNNIYYVSGDSLEETLDETIDIIENSDRIYGKMINILKTDSNDT